MANSRKPGLDRYSPEEIEAALAIVKRLEEARRKGGQASGRWGTPEQRRERAKKAAEARWANTTPEEARRQARAALAKRRAAAQPQSE